MPGQLCITKHYVYILSEKGECPLTFPLFGFIRKIGDIFFRVCVSF